MTPFEKAAYITKFFAMLDDNSNGHISATFNFKSQRFDIEVFGSKYTASIEEAQMFIIGWNVCQKHYNKTED